MSYNQYKDLYIRIGEVMIPHYLDIILRVGRLLGTIRSLVIQVEQLAEVVGDYAVSESIVADGLDL